METNVNNTTEPQHDAKHVLPAVISEMCEAMEKANVIFTFGLQPHEIKTIEAELERFGNEVQM